MLTKEDVRSDPIIARRIRRMQKAELEGDSSEDEVQAPRQDIRQIDGSDDVTETPSRLQVSGTQQPPESSIVEDLGDPSDSEMSA
jgi:hypothetical protein